MKLRLDPADEYMHPLETASNFNESMYFNAFDSAQQVGGFVRLGNRPNEGYAELTVCWYLPDGRVAFFFNRPERHDNDAFDAGGLRFDVITPFEELRVRYDGKVVLLDDPTQMADPRTAFKTNPWTDCHVDLTFRGVSPMYGGEPVNDDDTPLIQTDQQNPFAKGHYEQHVAATGTLTVGDDTWELDALGLRDHSWGPRYWQAPWWYRWCTANLGRDFGFVLSLIASRNGSRVVGGMVLHDGAYDHITHLAIRSDYDADTYHRAVHADVTCESGATFTIEGRVKSLIPLRNRRTTPDGEQLRTRISEGLTEWRCDGRVGYGLAEYLDQIVDDAPVGNREESA